MLNVIELAGALQDYPRASKQEILGNLPEISRFKSFFQAIIQDIPEENSFSPSASQNTYIPLKELWIA